MRARVYNKQIAVKFSFMKHLRVDVQLPSTTIYACHFQRRVRSFASSTYAAREREGRIRDRKSALSDVCHDAMKYVLRAFTHGVGVRKSAEGEVGRIYEGGR